MYCICKPENLQAKKQYFDKEKCRSFDRHFVLYSFSSRVLITLFTAVVSTASIRPLS